MLLAIALSGYVRLRLLQVPLERDEGEYAYAGQLILEGVPPYALARNMKLPGAYAAYAVLRRVFGETIGGVHLGLMLVNAAAALLVFLLGRRLFGARGGLAACAAYAVMSVGDAVMGTQAHATHFVVLPALGGILLLLRATDTGRIDLVIWSGLRSSTASSSASSARCGWRGSTGAARGPGWRCSAPPCFCPSARRA
jgi:hypothetical protein